MCLLDICILGEYPKYSLNMSYFGIIQCYKTSLLTAVYCETKQVSIEKKTKQEESLAECLRDL